MTSTTVIRAQKAELSVGTINFGDIPMKPKSEQSVTLYNRTAKPIVINAINVDCNCTKVIWSKKPIMAADSTILNVVYAPLERGVFYKKAKIITSIGDMTLTIRGRVL